MKRKFKVIAKINLFAEIFTRLIGRKLPLLVYASKALASSSWGNCPDNSSGVVRLLRERQSRNRVDINFA